LPMGGHLFAQLAYELFAAEKHPESSPYFDDLVHVLPPRASSLKLLKRAQPLLRWLNYTAYGADHFFELRELCFQLPVARSRQAGGRSATGPGGHPPIPPYPAFDQHALQCGIERAFFHLENVIGAQPNGSGDFVAVHFAVAREGTEDQQVQSARQDF